MAEPGKLERLVVELARWLHVPIEPWFPMVLAGKMGVEIAKRLLALGKNPQLDGPRWRCEAGHDVRGYPFCHLCRYQISPGSSSGGRAPQSGVPDGPAPTNEALPCPTTTTADRLRTN